MGRWLEIFRALKSGVSVEDALNANPFIEAGPDAPQAKGNYNKNVINDEITNPLKPNGSPAGFSSEINTTNFPEPAPPAVPSSLKAPETPKNSGIEPLRYGVVSCGTDPKNATPGSSLAPASVTSQRSYYEFFAGGGMARAGLGPEWVCLLANDIDARKGAAYKANWKAGELHIKDVAKLSTVDLPGAATLAWASWPCTDLSLAGDRAGLAGERSGTFWPFWGLVRPCGREPGAPSHCARESPGF